MPQANLVQTSVAGGNQNALAAQGDGLILPKLSTAVRNALPLTSSDAGLTVYDTTIGSVLTWNGSIWVSAGNVTSANTQVIFNDNGGLIGDPNMTFDKVNGIMTNGTDSSTAVPVRRQRVFGNVRVDAGTGNPNGVEFRVIGPMLPYHSHQMINGLANGFAANADHTHCIWLNFASGNTQPRQTAQTIYTANTAGTSYIAHGAPITALGTEFINENSIDTTATVQTPTAPDYIGRVKFRFSTNPSIVLGENLLLQIINVQVTGIQAAVYSGVAATASTLVGSLWEVQVDVEGFDPLHWNWNNRADTTLQNANWQLNRLITPLTNTTRIDATPGDATAVDVTFSALPAGVSVGRGCSILIKAGSTLTGVQPNFLYPGYISAVNGLVATVRLRNARYRTWQNIGGSDTTPARFDMLLGIRDIFHDVVPSHIVWNQYRNADGTPTCNIFGPSDVGPSVDRSVVVGRNLVCTTSDEWLAGTDNVSNRMSLLGNILRVNGLNVGTGTNIAQIKHGRAVLVGGTVTVADASVTANSRIFVCGAIDGGTPGWLRVSARSAGVSFTVTSSSGTDTSSVDWLIINP